jgi:ferritin
MSSWCNSKGLEGSSSFLLAHANEELEHIHRLFDYVNQKVSQALIKSINGPKNQFKDMKEVFEETYKLLVKLMS